MHVAAKSGNLPMVKFLLKGWSSLATTEARQEGSRWRVAVGSSHSQRSKCSKSLFLTMKHDETIHPNPSSFFSWANACTATCFRMIWVYFRFIWLSFGLKLRGEESAGVP